MENTCVVNPSDFLAGLSFIVTFECPIDERVKISVSEDLSKETPHCTTLYKLNHECPFIKAGCIGCRFDKERILEARRIADIQYKGLM